MEWRMKVGTLRGRTVKELRFVLIAYLYLVAGQYVEGRGLDKKAYAQWFDRQLYAKLNRRVRTAQLITAWVLWCCDSEKYGQMISPTSDKSPGIGDRCSHPSIKRVREDLGYWLHRIELLYSRYAADYLQLELYGPGSLIGEPTYIGYDAKWREWVGETDIRRALNLQDVGRMMIGSAIQIDANELQDWFEGPRSVRWRIPNRAGLLPNAKAPPKAAKVKPVRPSPMATPDPVVRQLCLWGPADEPLIKPSPPRSEATLELLGVVLVDPGLQVVKVHRDAEPTSGHSGQTYIWAADK